MLEIDKLKSEAIHYKALAFKLYTALNTVVDRKAVKDSDLICKALLAYEYNKLK